MEFAINLSEDDGGLHDLSVNALTDLHDSIAT